MLTQLWQVLNMWHIIIRLLNHKLWMKLWLEICQTNGSKQQTLNMTHSCRMTLWNCQVEEKPSGSSGADGKVERFKARLVAKGYAQKMVLTMIKCFLQWWNSPQSEHYLHLLFNTTCYSIKWMLWPLSGRRYLHGTTRGLRSTRKGHLAKKVFERLEAITKILEQGFYRIPGVKSSADTCMYVRDTETLSIVAVLAVHGWATLLPGNYHQTRQG